MNHKWAQTPTTIEPKGFTKNLRTANTPPYEKTKYFINLYEIFVWCVMVLYHRPLRQKFRRWFYFSSLKVLFTHFVCLIISASLSFWSASSSLCNCDHVLRRKHDKLEPRQWLLFVDTSLVNYNFVININICFTWLSGRYIGRGLRSPDLRDPNDSFFFGFCDDASLIFVWSKFDYYYFRLILGKDWS